MFHYGSISLIVEPCRSAHLKAMEVAKEAGALLSYDPNLRLPLWPSKEEAKKQILSIWDKAEVIKVSDEELMFLTGSDNVDDETVEDEGNADADDEDDDEDEDDVDELVLLLVVLLFS